MLDVSIHGEITIKIDKDVIKVIIKPNSKENKIVCFDSDKQAYKIDIKAKAERNKANIELIRFLSRTLKKKVKIKRGLKSREKIIKTG